LREIAAGRLQQVGGRQTLFIEDVPLIQQLDVCTPHKQIDQSMRAITRQNRFLQRLHFSVARSVSLSDLYTVLKLFDGFQCRLAGTLFTRCFIKGPLFVFFIIHSSDDQFTQNLYHL